MNKHTYLSGAATCAAMIAALTFLAPQAGAEEQDCRLQLAATLPISKLHNGRVLEVEAAVNGQPVTLQVDTGAGNTILRESKAKELGLRPEMLQTYIRAEIFGGIEIHRTVAPKDFSLGNLHAAGVTILLAPDSDKLKSLPDGLLGANVLSAYDVDIDMTKGIMHLFQPHRCAGQAVYWTQNEDLIAKIPFRYFGHIGVPVTLDGEKFEAILDTGASGSVMDFDLAKRKYGITPESPDVKTFQREGMKEANYRAPFKTLSFEGVTVNNPQITLIPYANSHEKNTKMLLGMNVLSKLHLYIAYKERMLYVTAADAH